MERTSNPTQPEKPTFITRFKDFVIQSPSDIHKPGRRWMTRLWIISIYIAGIGIWLIVLNFGNFDWGIQDWFWAYRYGSAITATLESGYLPFHIEPPVNYLISRYLAIPDYPLAPQFFLAGSLGLGRMYLVNDLLLYTVGFLGCLLIKRHFKLSLFTFTAITALYSLNGYITSHLSVGHWQFSGYFYLPVFAYLIVRLFESEPPKAWFAKMGLVLFGMLLQGSVRLFTGCVLFLGILWLFSPGVRKQLIGGILAGVALNLYRLAPAAIELGAETAVPYGGYESLGHMFRAMVQLVHTYDAEAGLPLAWWEFDVYIGFSGLALIAVFGLYFNFLRKHETPEPWKQSLSPLGYTILSFFILSSNYVFQMINRSPFPLVRLFHVPSRLLILPLTILILLAAIQLQNWLNTKSLDTMEFAFLGTGLIYLVLDLVAHARVWRVTLVNEAFDPQPYMETFQVVPRNDPIYVTIVAVSALISAITLVLMMTRIWRTRRM